MNTLGWILVVLGAGSLLASRQHAVLPEPDRNDKIAVRLFLVAGVALVCAGLAIVF